MGLTWFITFQAIFSWWEAYNVEWWIGTSLPLWLLVGLALPPNRAAVAVGTLVVAAATSVNLFRMILPSTCPGPDENEVAARTLIDATRPGDTVWVPDADVEHWVKLLSRCDRDVYFSGYDMEAERKRDLITKLADPAGFCAPGGNLYISDGEWCTLPFADPSRENDAAREALYTILYYGEPAATVWEKGNWSTYVRYRRPPQRLEAFELYGITDDKHQGEAKCLGNWHDVAAVTITVPADGVYALALQAQAPQGGDVPVLVAVDGRWVAVLRVNAVTWTFYEFETDLAVGRHVVTARLAASARGGPVLVKRLALYRPPI